MFAGIDLYLEFQSCLRSDFRCELEHKVHRVPGLRATAFSEPGQSVAYGIDGCPDGFGARLHKVNVFGISQRSLEQQFVNRCAAAKSNLPLQSRCAEQITERTGDDEILFYLPQIGPRRSRTPRLNIRPRDQESTSTGSLIRSFHLEFLSPGSARDETSGFAAGFNGTRLFALLTNDSSDLA